nr:hypothetical protein [Tanacetum cinerariifolium]
MLLILNSFGTLPVPKTINSVKQIHVVVDGRAVVISESLVRSDLLFEDEDGITCLTNDEIFENLALMGYEPLSTKLTFQKDEAVNQEEGDRVEMAITTDARLETAQDNTKTMRGTSAQTRSERVLKQPNDPPFTEETGILTTKVVYNKAFITLTNRVKKLESQLKQKRSRAIIHSSDEEEPIMHIKDSSKQWRIIKEMDKDENINLVSKQGEVHETAEHSRDDDDETLTETLVNIKRSSAKDKGKGIMQETELPKKLKKKKMIHLSLDEELAQKLTFSKAEVRRNMIMYSKNQGGYRQSYFIGMKYEDIRPLFERIWDQVYTFVPKDFEIKREVMKRARFDLHQGSSKKQRLGQQTEETKEEAGAQGDSDQEVEELKLYMRIITEEDMKPYL